MRSVIPIIQSTSPSRCFSVCITHTRVHMLRYRYGAHLSKEQVAELVAPHPDTIELIGSWFEHHEVPSSAVSITHGGGWLAIKKVPLTKANALLGASYQNYRHRETNETVIRTIGYSLPAALHEHVQTVAPTTYFESPRPLRRTSKLALNATTLPGGDPGLQDSLTTFTPGDLVPPNCSSIITPTCLRLLYKTWAYKPRATSKNKIGITGYTEQYASYSDLTTFLTRFRKDATTANFSVVTVNGGIDDQSQPGLEVRLVLHVEGKCGVVFISSHRLISISNTPSRSPTRPRTSSIAQPALHPLSLMTIPPRTRTSHTWTGSISS
jgi:tripeptidyl-peptidase I